MNRRLYSHCFCQEFRYKLLCLLQIVQALNYELKNPDNESVISDVHKDGQPDPLSSTLTELQDYLSTAKSDLGNSRTASLPSRSTPAWNTNAHIADTASKRDPKSGLPSQTESSVSDTWKRPSQLHPYAEVFPMYKQESWEQHLSSHRANDSVLRREQQFQAGLQDLSDKLRQNDLYSSKAQLQVSVEDERQERWKHEDIESKANQWEEIQQLLKSKLDEVSQCNILCKRPVLSI